MMSTTTDPLNFRDLCLTKMLADLNFLLKISVIGTWLNCDLQALIYFQHFQMSLKILLT